MDCFLLMFILQWGQLFTLHHSNNKHIKRSVVLLAYCRGLPEENNIISLGTIPEVATHQRSSPLSKCVDQGPPL